MQIETFHHGLFLNGHPLTELVPQGEGRSAGEHDVVTSCLIGRYGSSSPKIGSLPAVSQFGDRYSSSDSTSVGAGLVMSST